METEKTRRINNYKLIGKMERKYLSIKESAEYLGVSKQYIYILTSKKLIPHFKLNNGKRGKIVLDVEDIQKWVERGRVETIDEAKKINN